MQTNFNIYSCYVSKNKRPKRSGRSRCPVDLCIRFVLALLLLGASPLLKAAEAARPNIVLILMDDMGWKDLGCFGAKLYETPNIDKLCAAGTRFSTAYTTAAICSPARASLMTGMHPVRLGMWNHIHYIRPGIPILPSYLKAARYQTWHVGKWHMGNPAEKTMPTDLGFDVNRGGGIAWGPGSYFWPYGCKPDGTGKNVRDSVPSLFIGGHEGEYLTDRLTDEALKLLDKRDPNRPFFLNLWHHGVHDPHEGKPELVAKYARKIKALGIHHTFRLDPKTGSHLVTSEDNPVYAAMIESLDQSVGRIVERLKRDGVFENTLFVFYSDNGAVTDHVPCAPLNGGKNSTYEAGERVPAFVTWPGHVAPGMTCDDPVYLTDMFFTILGAARVAAPDRDRDGISLLPYFNGAKIPPRDFFWYFPDSRLKWAQRANAAIRSKAGLKFVMFFNGDADELYDLNTDLPEAHDIIKELPEQAEALRKRLVELLAPHYPDMPSPPKQFIAGVEKRLGLPPGTKTLGAK